MDDPVAPEPSPPLVQPATPKHRSGARLVHLAKELVTVFIGVYAAFALNNYQAHRQDRQRREQILAWAQREYGGTLTFLTDESVHLRAADEILERRIKAGEMPPLRPFNFSSDYNPTDFTSMLQSGGFDLLEVETVRDLREVEGSLRRLVEVIRHDQQLSDTLILPNLENQPGVFYNLETRQLRPAYKWYPEYLTTQLEILAQMKTEIDHLLAQLRAERARNR